LQLRRDPEPTEITLSTLYLIALGAVSVAILGALVDAVLSVSRPKNWTVRRTILTAVDTTDRRVQDLPIVGRDRRQGPDTQAGEPDRKSA
jgi:hypothetical protein